jgi:hypothetical protein
MWLIIAMIFNIERLVKLIGVANAEVTGSGGWSEAEPPADRLTDG